MPAKEYRFLMNNKNEMSFDELRDLLIDNEVKNFDPVAEAFKVYDPEGSGFVDTEVLRSIFESLGFGEITDDGATHARHEGMRPSLHLRSFRMRARARKQISRSWSRPAMWMVMGRSRSPISGTCWISTRRRAQRAIKRKPHN